MSRKQMAGGRGRVVSRPASVKDCSKPPMMFDVHACACRACQMATIASSVAWVDSRFSADSERAPSAAAIAPLAIIGSIRSDRQASDSVSATRPRASPMTRSRRSIEIGRKPIARRPSMNGTTASSSSRNRSLGFGTAPPVASRMSIRRLSGAPVRLLSASNVSSLRVAKRS
jgi:hypothetical protein